MTADLARKREPIVYPSGTGFRAELVTELVEFCVERHKIYVRRFVIGDPPPWTDDPILQRYHFCNVYRYLDRTTIWLKDEWYPRVIVDPVLAAAIARIFNEPNSLDLIRDQLADFPGRSLEILRDARSHGVRVFNSRAYLVTAGRSAAPGESYELLPSIVETLAAVARSSCDAATLRGVVDHLIRFPGFGPMIATQAALDLALTPRLWDAADRETFCSIGPGSGKMLGEMFGQAVDVAHWSAYPQERGRDQVLRVRELALEEWPSELPPPTAADVEHALCELYKYRRIASGDLKNNPRRYRP